MISRRKEVALSSAAVVIRSRVPPTFSPPQLPLPHSLSLSPLLVSLSENVTARYWNCSGAGIVERERDKPPAAQETFVSSQAVHSTSKNNPFDFSSCFFCFRFFSRVLGPFQILPRSKRTQNNLASSQAIHSTSKKEGKETELPRSFPDFSSFF